MYESGDIELEGAKNETIDGRTVQRLKALHEIRGVAWGV